MTIDSRFGRGMLGFLPAVVFATTVQFSFAQSGDAATGREMLSVRGCTSCHPVTGSGGGSAPDLGLVAGNNVSPAELAATMWNHGPKMWKLMDESNLTIPALSEFEIVNLFAYFYSLRYVDPPGDSQRGEEVFERNKCSHCHNRTPSETKKGAGPPVSSWVGMVNRVDWVQQMWNHGAGMAKKIELRGMEWPEFTLGEMVDWSAGEQLFEERSCAECHTVGESVSGKVDLLEAARYEPRLSGLAVEMWNHRPRMEAEARRRGLTLQNFESTEMEDVVAYLFKKGYFEASGDKGRGAQLVQDKGCTSCHGQADSEAVELSGFEEGYSAVRLAWAVWIHGPGMKDMIDYRGKDWPTMTPPDVANLVALLNNN